MKFYENGFIILRKEINDEEEGYFLELDTDGYTEILLDAYIAFDEKDAKEQIQTLNNPSNHIYKPIQITYDIKDLKLG